MRGSATVLRLSNSKFSSFGSMLMIRAFGYRDANYSAANPTSTIQYDTRLFRSENNVRYMIAAVHQDLNRTKRSPAKGLITISMSLPVTNVALQEIVTHRCARPTMLLA